MNKIFVTGIGTDVGKTVVSAILTEALEADYWKPIQTGSSQDSDTETVKRLISNSNSKFYPELYKLDAESSPHIAAMLESKTIELSNLISQLSILKESYNPIGYRSLIIEGAGGIMVPINKKNRMIDLIESFEAQPIIVSKHYLGSINHTILTFEALMNKGIKPLAIVFNGEDKQGSEEIILHYTGMEVLTRVKYELIWNKRIVKKYAEDVKKKLPIFKF